MIDFRYHIVSLISVFLALAIGIVLGAGPLKDAIGDKLTGQVQDLRAGKEDLRVKLSDVENDMNRKDEFISGISGRVLAETLPGRRVVIVELDSTPDEITEGITEQLVAAGATVTDRVRIDASWTSDSKATFRQSFASSLVSYLDTTSTETTADENLAVALVQSLTAIDPEDESQPSAAAADIRSLLSASDLVSYKEMAGPPADMIVFVSNPAGFDDAGDNTGEEEARAQTMQLHGLLANVATRHTEASVVVSISAVEDDLLKEIRTNSAYAEAISTVADGRQLSGQINVALTLAARATGKVGQFGDQPDATAAVPDAIRLNTVDRSSRKAAMPEPEEPSGQGPGSENTDASTEEASAEDQE